MKFLLTMILTAVLLLAGIGGTLRWATASEAPSPSRIVKTTTKEKHDLLPLCEYEDGSGQRLCVWDGSGDSGNGVGLSYIVQRWGKGLKKEQFFYIPASAAHALTH